MSTDFAMFPKIPRLSRDIVITEKIDGTCAVIFVGEDGEFLTGSRKRWITPDDDNFGFSRWAHEHRDELVVGLGVGRHYGEWWGCGIQRRYGLSEKRFSLFNTGRWHDTDDPTEDANVPECCRVVPTLYTGPFDHDAVDRALELLQTYGSCAAHGFMDPEGIVIYHTAARLYFKKTIVRDEYHKGES